MADTTKVKLLNSTFASAFTKKKRLKNHDQTISKVNLKKTKKKKRKVCRS